MISLFIREYSSTRSYGRRVYIQWLVILLWMVGFASNSFGQIDPHKLYGMKPRSIGPAGMSGRMTAIAVVPHQPRVIYAGSATGGAWKSTDAGATWNPIFDDQPASSIADIAIYPQNPRIIWIATGEDNPRNSAGMGYGLYKSTNGGASWKQVGFTKTERFADIVLHPNNPEIAYAGVMGPTWSDSKQRGVFKTTDGGKTWEKILYVNQRTGVSSLVMDPKNPDKLIAGTWSHRRWPWFFKSGGSGSGLYITENGGKKWTELTSLDGLPGGNLGRIGLAIAPTKPNVVYATIEADTNGLYRSVDGGYTWNLMNNTKDADYRPFYFSDLKVSPVDADLVYLLHEVLLVSDDGGRTLKFHSGRGVHGDHQDLWIDPQNPNYQIDANDGGLYITHDRGDSWSHVETLPVSQFYHVSVDMQRPYRVSGGLQDNGTWVGPNATWSSAGIRNEDWTKVGGGDGFYSIIDPVNPGYGYSSWQAGHFRRFDLKTGESYSIRPAPPDSVDKLRFGWNAAFAIEPQHPKTIYVGSQFVHKSMDQGRHWQVISPDLTTNNPDWQRQLESGGLTIDQTRAENFTTITNIAPSPLKDNVIWAGTDDGRVQVTKNGGFEWNSVENNIPDIPDHTWVSHIEASKYDDATAFVVFDDHRRGNWSPYVYRTTDFGQTWKSIAPKKMHGFARTIEQDPRNPKILYLGTEFALLMSIDGGNSWFKWDEGLPTTEYRSLVVHPRDNDLVIGTHGRGIYILDDLTPLQQLAKNPSIQYQSLHIFDIPTTYEHEMVFARGQSEGGNTGFVGQNPMYGAMISFWLKDDAPQDDAWVEISEGDSVIKKFRQPVHSGINRIHWNLHNEMYRTPIYSGQSYHKRGFEVLPGRYTVHISYQHVEDSAVVDVRPDPRLNIPVSEREEKFSALKRVARLMNTLTQSVNRLNATLESVQLAEENLSKKSGKGGILFDKAMMLSKDLKSIKQLFVQKPSQDVIREPDNVEFKLQRALYFFDDSWRAPTPAQLRYLDIARDALTSAVEQMNQLYKQDIKPFKKELQHAGIASFPDYSPITLTEE